jgi:hypothetical protein
LEIVTGIDIPQKFYSKKKIDSQPNELKWEPGELLMKVGYIVFSPLSFCCPVCFPLSFDVKRMIRDRYLSFIPKMSHLISSLDSGVRICL